MLRAKFAPALEPRPHAPPASQQDRSRGHGARVHPSGRARPSCAPEHTPHTLRRIYISVALLANKFDVLWVMRQVGHADSKMTMDVYAQLQQRAERRHGEASDALVRRARERLYGITDDPEEEPSQHASGEKIVEDVVDA